MSQAGVEDGYNAGTGVTDVIRSSTPGTHLTPQDNQIMDLDGTETGGVVFVAQTDTGGSTDSETVSLICYSTPPPRLTFLQDDNQIVGLNDGETRDVVSVLQVDAGDENKSGSEAVNIIRRSTTALIAHLSLGHRPDHGSRRYKG